MSNRETTACFTGHRKLREPAADITARITETIENLIQSGYQTFCAGGARGFDALASEVVLSLQARYPQINLVLTLPFYNQYRFERGWSEAEIEQYHMFQEKAAHTTILSQDFRGGMYHQRKPVLSGRAALWAIWYSPTSWAAIWSRIRSMRISSASCALWAFQRRACTI